MNFGETLTFSPWRLFSPLLSSHLLPSPLLLYLPLLSSSVLNSPSLSPLLSFSLCFSSILLFLPSPLLFTFPSLLPTLPSPLSPPSSPQTGFIMWLLYFISIVSAYIWLILELHSNSGLHDWASCSHTVTWGLRGNQSTMSGPGFGKTPLQDKGRW